MWAMPLSLRYWTKLTAKKLLPTPPLPLMMALNCFCMILVKGFLNRRCVGLVCAATTGRGNAPAVPAKSLGCFQVTVAPAKLLTMDFGRAGFVGATLVFGRSRRGKNDRPYRGNDDVHILQKQPDVVVGCLSLTKLFDLLFVGKHLRQLGRQVWAGSRWQAP
jgi:hypothetical protein